MALPRSSASWLLLLFAPAVLGHMPAFAGTTSRQDPLDLGDITKNSWALSGTLSPGEVQHFKFTIDGTVTGSKGRFHMGLYVPGEGEDFRFYVAIFGLNADTECERWGDGWGRRLQERRRLVHPPLPVHRNTSDGTTWLAGSDTYLPSVVIGDGDEDLPVNYTNPDERLIFIADPACDLPNKFEPFSPTLFKPRGSCITDFPRTGEYRIAVWGDDTMASPKRFSVGLGLAERDVFSPRSLLLFDFTLMRIQTWNGWSPIVLLLPIIIALLLLACLLLVLKKKAPKRFGTSSGLPTPFRLLACLGGTILLGHVVANIMVFIWAVSNADPHGEFAFALITGIVLPLNSGFWALYIGLRMPCCCGPASIKMHCGHRCSLIPLGLLHLMLHAGYIIGPATLLIAAVLPSCLADRGILEGVVPAMHSGAKKETKVEIETTSAADVQKTPPSTSFSFGAV